MSRTLACLTAALGLAVLASSAHGAGEISQAAAEQRAITSYTLMQRYFFLPGGYYAGTYPPEGNGHAQVWPYSQALEATLEVARLPGAGGLALAALPARIAGLAPYRAPLRNELAYAPLYGGGGNVFYDDNVWVGAELVEAAGLLHEPSLLTAAQRVLAWIETGWDATAAACPGGIYWLMPGGPYWDHSAANRYRAAVSTVNAALLGVLLYERTGRRPDLRFAERAYDWSQRCLSTTQGLIADHIDATGAVDGTIHSYNEGAMVATALNLYRVTRRRRYLAEALRTAQASLPLFSSAAGRQEPASFLAIYYADLLPLIPAAHGAAIRAQIADFARRAWLEERDPGTGLFHFGHTYATLLDQSAMVEIYAELAETS